MNEKDIKNILSALDRPLTLSYVEETASTNDDLKAAAKSGAPDFTLLIAGKQSKGRGREGRSFFSEGGLYMSLLLPALPEVCPFLTHLTAVAVACAIQEVTGADARIKWVNDVYVSGKKVCGILTENIGVNNARRLVVGIGVNIGKEQKDFPPEIRETAASLSCDKTSLTAAILKEFFMRFDAFSPALLKQEYRERCFLLGKKVLVIKNDGGREATVLDLTDDLGLDVLYDDGKREHLISGEVSLRSIF